MYLKKSLEELEKINSIRNSIDDKNLDLKSAVDYYTNLNNSFIKVIFEVIKLSNFAHVTKDINAYVNFIMIKEKSWNWKSYWFCGFFREKSCFNWVKK